MKVKPYLQLQKASADNLKEIWAMQIASFAQMLENYQDYDMSPGAERLEDLEARFHQPWTTYYFIIADGVKVGAVRIIDYQDSAKRKRIAPIFILPEHRNKSYAQLAIQEAERIHGDHHWMLDTILQEEGNLYLYEKMGYHQTGKLEKINDRMTIVYYEKD